MPMSWLNALALINVLCKLETEATFHSPMAALNVSPILRPENTSNRVTTEAVFQPAISPNLAEAVAGSDANDETAAWMLRPPTLASMQATQRLKTSQP